MLRGRPVRPSAPLPPDLLLVPEAGAGRRLHHHRQQGLPVRHDQDGARRSEVTRGESLSGSGKPGRCVVMCCFYIMLCGKYFGNRVWGNAILVLDVTCCTVCLTIKFTLTLMHVIH